jgi:hypothetical protein
MELRLNWTMFRDLFRSSDFDEKPLVCSSMDFDASFYRVFTGPISMDAEWKAKLDYDAVASAFSDIM